MVAFLLFALLSVEPTPGIGAVWVPRVLGEEIPVLAMVADGQFVYAQTGAGLVAWDGKGKRRPLNRIMGEYNAGLALDTDHAFFIADGKVWKTPKPGRRGPSHVLATAPEGLGLAVLGDDVFFTDGKTSQIYRVGKDGGEPVGLVTTGVEGRKRADSAGLGQGVAGDDRTVYWVFEDRVLRVARAGGTARVVATSPTLNSQVLVLDGGGLLYADGQGTYRLDDLDGGSPERFLACPASLVTATSEHLYLACGRDLWRVSRDGRTRELLDTGPTEKSAVAVLGQNVFFADSQSGNILSSLLVLNVGERPPASTKGKPGYREAVRATRRWIAELGTPEAALALPAPVSLHLGSDVEDDWSLTTTLRDPARLRAVAAELQGKRHPLLGFHTRYAWRLLRPRDVSALDGAKKRQLGRLAGKRTVLISHRTSGNCPYREVIVVVDRVGKIVVPTTVYFESGYDCE